MKLHSVKTFRKLHKGMRTIRMENIFYFTRDSSAINNFNVLTFEIIDLEAKRTFSNSLGALGFIFPFSICCYIGAVLHYQFTDCKCLFLLYSSISIRSWWDYPSVYFEY